MQALMECVSTVPKPVAKHFSRGKEVNVLAAMARAGRLWDQGALHQTDGREGQRSLHHPGADSWTDFGGSLDAPWLAYSSGSGISASPVRASDEREAIPAFIRFCLNFVPLSRRKAGVQSKKEFPSHQTPLVFTYHDLAPRNVILDDRRRLWLLDWDYSGFYPVYFEYASMHNFSVPENWGWADRLRWEIFSWISVGRFSKQREALEEIRPRFTRFPLGRKNEVLLDGAPSNAVHLRKPGM
ncbi:hypothetical protein RJZ90_006311 [Blastomyces dermatitidis]